MWSGEARREWEGDVDGCQCACRERGAGGVWCGVVWGVGVVTGRGSRATRGSKMAGFPAKLAALGALATALYLATPPDGFAGGPHRLPHEVRAVRSSRVALPDVSGAGVKIVPATVFIGDDGRIEKIVGENDPDSGPGAGVYSFGDALIAPGVVDAHTHLNEPGREEWEGFETGTSAAAAGGITTVVDMPLNSSPVVTTAEALRGKQAASTGKLAVDVAFWGGLVPENAADEAVLGELLDAGVVGLKSFMCPSGIDEFGHTGAADFEAAAAALVSRSKPLMAHAEKALEGEAAAEAKAAAAAHAPTSHASWALTRPGTMERAAVDELIAVAKKLGSGGAPRIHVAHVADVAAAAAIAAAQAEGVDITGETCPHYLTFAAEEVPEGATQYKCAPPIRPSETRSALAQTLRAGGALAMVSSDHSPAPADVKAFPGEPGVDGDFTKAWGGIAGLQMLLPATWTAVKRVGMEVSDAVRLLSVAPAQVAGLGSRKGSIAVGKDADFVVWDPEGKSVLCDGSSEPAPGGCTQRNRHKHKLSPYNNLVLDGAVIATIVRGNVVYDGRNDAVSQSRNGRPVLV